MGEFGWDGGVWVGWGSLGGMREFGWDGRRSLGFLGESIMGNKGVFRSVLSVLVIAFGVLGIRGRFMV